MLPVHVSIIMDGNGRWAKKMGKERLFGHLEGKESVRACCEEAVALGIKYLSLFAFSEENWNRPSEEVRGLMNLMLQSVLGEKETFRKNGIRFRVIGNKERLSPELLSEIAKCEEETSGYSNMTLLIMLSYSGKWDIMQAARRYAEDAVKATMEGREIPPMEEASFSPYLATAGIPDPDLIIRTSGEQRISNYMLWQSAYSEFYFTDILWPEFRKDEFRQAVESFENRDRRYGKVK